MQHVSPINDYEIFMAWIPIFLFCFFLFCCAVIKHCEMGRTDGGGEGERTNIHTFCWKVTVPQPFATYYSSGGGGGGDSHMKWSGCSSYRLGVFIWSYMVGMLTNWQSWIDRYACCGAIVSIDLSREFHRCSLKRNSYLLDGIHWQTDSQHLGCGMAWNKIM